MSKKKNHKQPAASKTRPVKREKAETKAASPSGEAVAEQKRRFRSPGELLADF